VYGRTSGAVWGTQVLRRCIYHHQLPVNDPAHLHSSFAVSQCIYQHPWLALPASVQDKYFNALVSCCIAAAGFAPPGRLSDASRVTGPRRCHSRPVLILREPDLIRFGPAGLRNPARVPVSSVGSRCRGFAETALIISLGCAALCFPPSRPVAPATSCQHHIAGRTLGSCILDRFTMYTA
jgi:hypothetical protein